MCRSMIIGNEKQTYHACSTHRPSYVSDDCAGVSDTIPIYPSEEEAYVAGWRKNKEDHSVWVCPECSCERKVLGGRP